MQERVPVDRHYPWRVLVCCALLNRTGRKQVRPMFEALFEACREPQDVLRWDGLEELLKPLGLQNRRADLLRRLTQDWIDGKPYDQCHGVGQYAADAYMIFVEGRTDVKPADHFLKPYLTWRKRYGKAQWCPGDDGRGGGFSGAQWRDRA